MMYLCTHAQRGGREKEEEREEMRGREENRKDGGNECISSSTVHSRSAKAPFMNILPNVSTCPLTLLCSYLYGILSVSIALIMACMAVKMFWYTSLVKPLLSSSEYPDPWMILICLMKVLLPLSPVPGMENGSSTLDHNSFASLQITKLDTSPDFEDTKRPVERSTHRKSKCYLQRTLRKLDQWWSISKA